MFQKRIPSDLPMGLGAFRRKDTLPDETYAQHCAAGCGVSLIARRWRPSLPMQIAVMLWKRLSTFYYYFIFFLMYLKDSGEGGVVKSQQVCNAPMVGESLF